MPPSRCFSSIKCSCVSISGALKTRSEIAFRASAGRTGFLADLPAASAAWLVDEFNAASAPSAANPSNAARRDMRCFAFIGRQEVGARHPQWQARSSRGRAHSRVPEKVGRLAESCNWTGTALWSCQRNASRTAARDASTVRRSEADVKPMWNRCGTEMKPNWNRTATQRHATSSSVPRLQSARPRRSPPTLVRTGLPGWLGPEPFI